MGIGFGYYKQAFNSLIKSTKKYIYFLPQIFIGMFPVLNLFVNNIEEVPTSLIWRPIFYVIFASTLLTLVLYRFLKNKLRSSVLVSLFWITFFTSVPLAQFIGEDFLSVPGSETTLTLFTFVVVITLLTLIINKFHVLTPILYRLFLTIGLVLMSLQLVPISSHKLQATIADTGKVLVNNVSGLEIPEAQSNPLPDIYYIMPDSYPRSDTLKDYFNHDNSLFDERLVELGFFMASESYSNYNHTILSLPSTLNMSYFDDPKELDKTMLIEMYQRSRVSDFLNKLGYGFINNSSYFSTDFNKYADKNILCSQGNEFISEVLNITPLKSIGMLTNSTRQDKRDDTLCTLDGIDGNSRNKPKFVATHLLPPHPPYLFDADGADTTESNLSLSGRTRWFAKDLYINQLQYINGRLLETIQRILENDENSVIILQSDHGTLSSATEDKSLKDTRPVVLKERSRNYTAVYLPDSCQQHEFYKSMTSVNTFRLVFNACFDTSLDILEDKVYYADPLVYRGEFEDITKIVRNQATR